MAVFALLHPFPSSFSSHLQFKFKSKPNNFITNRQNHSLNPPLSITCSSKTTLKTHSNLSHQKIPPLKSIEPYIRSEWKPILKGWICSAISVYALSKVVPRIGKFSSVMSSVDAVQLRDDGLVIGLLFLVRLVAGYLQQAFLWDAALNSVYRIRVHVFDKVLQRDLGFFEGGSGVSSGDIAYRITAEASDVADTVYSLLNTIVPSSMQLSAMAAQMLAVSPSLSLISALVIPSMALVIAYLGRTLNKISKEANLSISALSAYLNEVLPAVLFVKANNAEVCESVRFKRLAGVDLSKRLKKKKMKALVPQIVKVVFFGVLLILCSGSLLISRGSFNCSSVVSFLTSLILLIEPIQDVGKSYNELKQGEPAIERLFDMSKFKSQVIEKSDATDLDSVTGEVKFSNVSFGYSDSSPLILNGLGLHIKAGETIALVGPSGGGKTTLVKLLLRLYDPKSGSVHIDDYDIQNIRLTSLRRHVGLVCQDTTLFSGTVAENIGYRDQLTKIDMEKVELAAKTANADEFIEKLPERYLTNIGPRGSSLSGGQRQRLAIARVVYQNPSILILDEATSALDSRSEMLVRQAVHRLMEDRTVLVIAHRLETVLMAERVFHLDGGKLTELSRSSLLDDSLASSSGISI